MSCPRISFEFFPPKNETQSSRFWLTLGHLLTLNPSFISMTWGALGSASQASLDILRPLVRDCPVPVMAHLTCAGMRENQMRRLIGELEEIGITKFLALRGDLVVESVETDSPAGNSKNSESYNALLANENNDRQLFKHASDLVALLAEVNDREISVAAYPEIHPDSTNVTTDIYWLKHKLDKGADNAITQFFFDADVFLRFRDRADAARISQTLIPGILPINNIENVAKFANKCGAVIPDAVYQRFSQAQTAEQRHEVGFEHCVEMCQKLRAEGVDDFHLYSLNQYALAYDVAANILGVNAPLAKNTSIIAAA